ncbi:MAG: hypothetical protein SGARI_001130, partial [Bacillariaceae sp.]
MPMITSKTAVYKHVVRNGTDAVEERVFTPDQLMEGGHKERLLEQASNFTVWYQEAIPPEFLEEMSVGIKHSNGLIEKVPAVFQHCRDGTAAAEAGNRCPFTGRSDAIYNGKPLFLRIYMDPSGGNTSNSKERQSLMKNLFAVTQYDNDSDRHVLVFHEVRQNETPKARVRRVVCRGDVLCPKDCFYKQQETNSQYPYYWDPEDDLCKSQNPEVLARYGRESCGCKGTCLTPEAVEDTEVGRVWPWESKAERAKYYKDETGVQSRMIAVKQHASKIRQRRHQETAEYKARFECQNTTKKATTIPFNAYAYFQHHLLFIPKAKLIFCGVPKSGITEWIKFVRFVMGARDYLATPHDKKDWQDFRMENLPPEKASELILDPTWTKAVFFRDPAERLLSAYLNKV